MMASRFIFYFFQAVLTPALCAHAAAGWIISATVTDLSGQPAHDYRAVMTLCGPDLRINTSDFTGDATHLIMKSTNNSVLHVNATTRIYQRIDVRTAAQIGRHVDTVHGYFRKQMGKWQNKPAVKETIIVKNTGEKRTIQGLKCRKYEIWLGTEKKRQVWVVPWNQAGLEKTSFQSVRQLAVLYEEVKRLPGVMLTLADGETVSLAGVPDIDGYPVLIEHLAQDRVVCRMQMGRPEKTVVQESAFIVPDGYRIQWF